MVMQESYVIYHRNTSFLFSKLIGHFIAKLLALLFFIWWLFYNGQIQHLKEEFKKERGAVFLPKGSSGEV